MSKEVQKIGLALQRARKAIVTFLKEEKSDRTYDSWVFIVVATILIGIVVGVVEVNLTMEKIFPAKEDRYDIDTIYIGLMKELCPDEARDPSIVNFESCEAKLDTRKIAGSNEDAGYTAVKVPTFDEAVKGTPNLYGLMLRNPELKKLTDGMAAGEFYLVKIKVPAKYITLDGSYRKPGQASTFTDDALKPWVLTYGGQRFGQVCFDGRCGQAMREGLTGFRSVYLVSTSLGPKDLVIFSAENENPLGLVTSEGFIISSAANLLRGNILYWFVSGMKGIRASSWFVALFLLAMFFAVTLRQFRDYPMFAYLAASFALWMITMQIGVILPFFRGKPQHLLKIWTNANLLLAICQFYLALTRSRERRYLADWSKSQLAISLVLIAVSTFLDGAMLARHANIIPTIFTAGAIFIPFAITARHLNIIQQQSKGVNPRTRRGLLVVLKRRKTEDIIHLTIWVMFAGSLAINTYRGLGNQLMHFSYTAAGLLLVSFGVMVYYTFTSGKNRLPKRSAAELEYLKDVMTTQNFSNHIAKPFSAVLKTSDIKNSSLIPADKKIEKQMMLARLLDQSRKRQEPIDFVWNLVKPIGDERQEIFCLKHEALADDLLEMVKLTIDTYEDDLDLVQTHFDFCGLHLALFGLQDLQVTDGSVLASEKTQGRVADQLDFASNEANLLLKYLSKSKRHGTFIVAGHSSLFSAELTSLLDGQEVQPLAGHLRWENSRRPAEEQIKPQLIAMAESLGLVFGYCRPKSKAASSRLPAAS